MQEVLADVRGEPGAAVRMPPWALTLWTSRLSFAHSLPAVRLDCSPAVPLGKGASRPGAPGAFCEGPELRDSLVCPARAAQPTPAPQTQLPICPPSPGTLCRGIQASAQRGGGPSRHSPSRPGRAGPQAAALRGRWPAGPAPCCHPGGRCRRRPWRRSGFCCSAGCGGGRRAGGCGGGGGRCGGGGAAPGAYPQVLALPGSLPVRQQALAGAGEHPGRGGGGSPGECPACSWLPQATGRRNAQSQQRPQRARLPGLCCAFHAIPHSVRLRAQVTLTFVPANATATAAPIPPPCRSPTSASATTWACTGVRRRRRGRTTREPSACW